jgi:hypothetical protein
MRFMWVEMEAGGTMRDEANAPTVPEVSSDSTQPAICADGGLRTASEEGHVAGAPLVPDLS